MSVKVAGIWDTVPGSGLRVLPKRSGPPRRHGPQSGVSLDLVIPHGKTRHLKLRWLCCFYPYNTLIISTRYAFSSSNCSSFSGRPAGKSKLTRNSSSSSLLRSRSSVIGRGLLGLAKKIWKEEGINGVLTHCGLNKNGRNLAHEIFNCILMLVFWLQFHSYFCWGSHWQLIHVMAWQWISLNPLPEPILKDE